MIVPPLREMETDLFSISKIRLDHKIKKENRVLSLHGMEDFKFLMEKSFFNKQTLKDKLNTIGIQEFLRDAILNAMKSIK